MDLTQIVKESYSCREVLKKIGCKNPSGQKVKKFREKILEQNLDISHFRKNGKNRRIYKLIKKKCSVCGEVFEALEGNKREKKTCSYSCSNKLFRSGPNNGNWKEDTYRTTCFYYHIKRCVICKENRIVEAHHADENKKNNDPSNLIPLCPTHHQYFHSRYKNIIENKVNKYINQWKQDNQ